MMLYLNQEELRQLGDELGAIITAWGERSRAQRKTDDSAGAQADGNDREQVFVFTHAFPFDDKPASKPPPAAT